MKAKNLVLTGLILSSGAATGIALINKYIKVNAISKHIHSDSDYLCFKWIHGNVYYKKSGSGRPLLLIHDLNVMSDSFEWSKIIPLLSQNHTVYAINLLGFGNSKKPGMTYTNYMFVQLISDFIKSEIGHRTNVITSGESASIALMACNNNPDLFDEMIFINPLRLVDYTQIPGKTARLYHWFLQLPMIGTLTYHIALSRNHIKNGLISESFFNPVLVNEHEIDRCYESSHLGHSPKSVYASIRCNYTKCNVTHSLKKTDNSICIIGAGEIEGIQDLLHEYQACNSSIEVELIPDTKKLPHFEKPNQVYQLIQTYLR